MYSVNLAQQTWDFIYSIGIGFLLGIIYDIINIKQYFKTRNNAILAIKDIIYILITAIITYLFILATNEGKMRAFLLLGEFLGFVIYYFSFGIIFRKSIDKMASIFKKIFAKLSPFIMKVQPFFNKTIKKVIFYLKKIKFILKRNKVMEYNLNN